MDGQPCHVDFSVLYPASMRNKSEVNLEDIKAAVLSNAKNDVAKTMNKSDTLSRGFKSKYVSSLF